eukprot:GHVU01010313.1.p3 GENE.GHVU01010313.1~~GHVU01010313.1.p3  ORF type:complete len:133 (-),score=2.78 GHVU01010313.1:405-803(-)
MPAARTHALARVGGRETATHAPTEIWTVGAGVHRRRYLSAYRMIGRIISRSVRSDRTGSASTQAPPTPTSPPIGGSLTGALHSPPRERESSRQTTKKKTLPMPARTRTQRRPHRHPHPHIHSSRMQRPLRIK